MAKDEGSLSEEKLKLDNPLLTTSYANFSHIVINDTDAYLYFGIQSPEGGVQNISIATRIVITHFTFLRMMEFWATRYSILSEIYGNVPKSLQDFDPAKVQQAFDKLINSPEQGIQEKTNV